MSVALTCRLETDDGTLVGMEAGRIVAPRPELGPAVGLGEGYLRPGLINAHDHLHRNHYPRLGAPPYADAYAWGLDLHDRWADEVARGRALPRRDALLFGALKNLLGGATTVVHHDPWEPDFERAFPVRVARIRSAHSLGFEPDLAAHAAESGTLPLCIHLAEGTNPAAADEVRTLEGLGLLDERLLAVHAVGVDDDGVRRLRHAGAAVVWCPTSNAFLFGRTAPRALIASGIDVLLGSDSLLTGGGTLLDEIAAARRLGWLDEARLADAVGATAARRLHLPPPSLSVGAPADLVHLGRPLLEATARDVRLVVVGGVPRLGDLRFAELFERAGVAVEPLRVGGVDKLVAAPLGSVVRGVVERWPGSGRILEPPESSHDLRRLDAQARAAGTARSPTLIWTPR